MSASATRDALVRQWHAIAAAIPHLDLDAPSRIDGWRNREVVAHLALQPRLLRRFIMTSSDDERPMSLADNLAGTRSRADLIDESARDGAHRGHDDFAASVEEALPLLAGADPGATIVSLQGPIRLRDYLVTRCVEAVVHGEDLAPPVRADDEARRITADALLESLRARAPELVPAARSLPPEVWIDVATGRRPPTSDALAAVVPVMS